MAGIETITPNQVLSAINYAKSQDKDDKFGDKAFRVNFNKIKNGSNGVRYIDFEVLKKRPNGKWEYVPINLKFMNLNTKSKILPPKDPKRKFPGVQLQFADDASYTVKTGKKDKNGKDILETEEYSKAKIAIAKAFQRIMINAIKSKKIYNDNLKICLPVQFERIVDEKTKKKEKLDHPIVRIEIKFIEDGENSELSDDIKESKKSFSFANKKDKDIDPNAKPRYDIYDAIKKIDRNDPRYKEGEFNFEYLKHEKDGKVSDLTYGNVGEIILPGSSVSGVDCMSSVTISNMGIGLPSKATLLIVKPSKGFKPIPTQIFNVNEIDSFSEAAVQNYQEEEEEKNEIEENKTEITKDEFDDISNDLNDDLADTDDTEVGADDDF